MQFKYIYEVKDFNVVRKDVIAINQTIVDGIKHTNVLQIKFMDICVEKETYIYYDTRLKMWMSPNHNDKWIPEYYFIDEYQAVKWAIKYFKKCPMVMSIFEYYDHTDYCDKYPHLML